MHTHTHIHTHTGGMSHRRECDQRVQWHNIRLRTDRNRKDIYNGRRPEWFCYEAHTHAHTYNTYRLRTHTVFCLDALSIFVAHAPLSLSLALCLSLSCSRTQHAHTHTHTHTHIRGIMPNSFYSIFQAVSLAPPHVEFLVRASFLEIYKVSVCVIYGCVCACACVCERERSSGCVCLICFYWYPK